MNNLSRPGRWIDGHWFDDPPPSFAGEIALAALIELLGDRRNGLFVRDKTLFVARGHPRLTATFKGYAEALARLPGCITRYQQQRFGKTRRPCLRLPLASLPPELSERLTSSG
jgi:hypothetical protein